jgi:hypothetical protein
MLSQLYCEIANAVALVPYHVQKYKEKDANAVILAAGATKAQKLDKDVDVRYEVGWVTARRAVLILTNDKLICDTWEIPISSIKDAKLLRIKSLFAKAFVLKVSSSDGYHYQFGLQYDSAWERQTALKLVIENGKIKYSLFSIIYRIVVWAFLLALLAGSLWYMYLDWYSFILKNR